LSENNKKETETMDTTAKVDIRKLQLLNDRIAQTIDALNQVRLSVHGLGLSHSSAGIPGAAAAFQSSPFAYANPYQSMYAAWPGVVPGISHSSPWTHPSYAQAATFGQSAAVNPLLSQLLWQQGVSGLSHSSDVGSYSPYHPSVDPITATRIMQMFPFAQMPISPVPQY
jgi:hypothetical protein